MKKNIIDLYHKARHENYPQKSGRVYSSEYTMPLSELIKAHQQREQGNIQSGMLPRSPEAIRRDAEKQYSRNKWLREGRVTNLDLQSHKQAWKLPYNPNPAQGFFPQANKLYTSQGFTSLDIETDDYNNPIAISATKFYRDENGQFRAVETFQRYYKSSNLRMQKTYPTHGLTRGILNKRRKEQGATYSEHYDWREKIELQKFLKNQIIVGHNIHEFDLPKLGLDNLYQSTIDTVTVARDIWTGQKNDLESVYQRIFGKTMAQAGFQHHDANADEIATMQILDAMMRKGSPRVRASLKYIEQHPEGVHFGTYNAYERSNLFTGNYNEYLGTSKIHEGGGRYIMTYDEDGNPLIKGMDEYMRPEEAGQIGMHVIEDTSLKDADILPTLLSSFKEVAEHMGSNVIAAQEQAQRMSENLNTWTQVKKGQLVHQLARMDVKEENRILQGYGSVFNNKQLREMVNKQRAYYESEQKRAFHEEAEAIKKENQRRKGEYNPSITEQYFKWPGHDKIREAADNMERIGDAIVKIAGAPIYNFERWEEAFTGQVGGISKAFGHLAPHFLSGPFYDLTNAGLNSLREQYAGLKYGMRTAGQLGNNLLAVGMGIPGPVGLGIKATGVAVGLGTQIVGNAGEGRIVKWGQGIQNNLNTLSLLTNVTLMPYKLMGEAIKTVNKALHSFRGAIHMTTGALSRLSGMGNPLTQMTGVGYGDYMGSVSADYASLLGKGTINNIYNEMSSQRAGLYTTGDIDVRRLVAASMLGVYEPIYGTGTDEKGNLAQAINKLAADLKGQNEFQKKTTYALANKINPNMGSILQTMDTLGVTRFEDLQRPAGMWGYDDSAYDRFRPRWQRAYWEYSYAGEQFGATRNRIATSLWNMVGKRGYNTINRMGGALADALDTGKWENVGNTIKAIWAELKDGAESVWKAIQKSFGMSGNAKFADVLKLGLRDVGISILKFARDTLIPGINSVWDAIVEGAFQKFGTFIDYLSTIKFDFKQFRWNIKNDNWDTPFITTAMDRAGKYDTAWARDVLESEKALGYKGTAESMQKVIAEQYQLPIRKIARSPEELARFKQFAEISKSNPKLAYDQFPEYGDSTARGLSDTAYGVYKSIRDKGRETMTAGIDRIIADEQAKSLVEHIKLGDDGTRLDIFLHDAKGNVTALKSVLNNSQITVRTSSDSRGNPVFNYVEKSSVKRSN